jgi:protein gp37
MGDNTGIEWADATWNPTAGCSVVSPGCANCYAMRVAGGRGKHLAKYAGLTRPSKAGPVWTGEVRLDEAALTWPLTKRRRRVIFVDSMSDLFHDEVEEHWLDEIFAVMAAASWHRFIVLTKRADRMRDYFRGEGLLERVEAMLGSLIDERVDPLARRSDDLRATAPDLSAEGTWPLPNVALGVSVEDQRRADERIPFLLETPAAIRLVSAEPLLGPLDLYNGDPDPRLGGHRATATYLGTWWEPGDPPKAPPRSGVDWVIAGGESGPGARPTHPDWLRSLRDQCLAAERAFFFKQWGEWAPIAFDDLASETLESEELAGRVAGFDDQPMHRVGKRAAGRLLDGREWSERPAWW